MFPLNSLFSVLVSSWFSQQEGLGGRTGALAVKLFLLPLPTMVEESSSNLLLLPLGLVRKSST